MRKPRMKASPRYDGGTVYTISKKDFELKQIAVTIASVDESTTIRSMGKNQYQEWVMAVGKDEQIISATIASHIGQREWSLIELRHWPGN